MQEFVAGKGEEERQHPKHHHSRVSLESLLLSRMSQSAAGKHVFIFIRCFTWKLLCFLQRALIRSVKVELRLVCIDFAWRAIPANPQQPFRWRDMILCSLGGMKGNLMQPALKKRSATCLSRSMSTRLWSYRYQLVLSDACWYWEQSLKLEAYLSVWSWAWWFTSVCVEAEASEASEASEATNQSSTQKALCKHSATA